MFAPHEKISVDDVGGFYRHAGNDLPKRFQFASAHSPICSQRFYRTRSQAIEALSDARQLSRVASPQVSPSLFAMFKPGDLFDLKQTRHASIFDGCQYGWEALKKLKDYIDANLKPRLYNTCKGNAYIGDEVFIGKGTVLEDGVMIKGPAIIGENCDIRHGAYFRENVVVGDNCVVGNACELKNAILFNEVEIPHLSYVGDSIFGFQSHLGAGVKISNIKLMPGNVTVEIDGRPFDTGLRKFGALLGDFSNVGCNSVLNPGTIIGRNSVIYPNVNWRGILPANMIAKNKAEPEVVVRKPRAS